MHLIGPFRQLLCMNNLALRGPLTDNSLAVIYEGGILVSNDFIKAVGDFSSLLHTYAKHKDITIHTIDEDLVALPGFIDAHTHICFAGSRAMDFAARNGGKSYLDIANAGGGIMSTVRNTRNASFEELLDGTMKRLNTLMRQGITTVEAKSGYGLSTNDELKMLRVLKQSNEKHILDIVSTCLAAHMKPKDFDGDSREYLNYILAEIVPVVKKEQLAKRFDIFVEQSAFSKEDALPYLKKLSTMGFDLSVHADQFSSGGSEVGVICGAQSVDHLEASKAPQIQMIAKSTTTATVLPGASIGLGYNFAPARSLLDAQCIVAIASDWNPGSAPQGQLLAQAAIMASYEKLSSAEVLAGITCRAAHALGLCDRGIISDGMLCDIVAFETKDYRDILYHQGSLQPVHLWKRGKQQF